MFEKFLSWIKGVLGLNRAKIEQITDSLVTSAAMWDAVQEWSAAFYNKPPWDKECKQKSTKFPGLVSGYAATLCAAELKLSTGSGARAEWLQEQIERFVLRDVRNSIQKAAAISYVALKPYVDGQNIYCDVATPDYFFPTSINGGMIQSGIFVDVAEVDKKTYIRLEEHTWNNGAVTITNRAFREDAVGKGKEVPLGTVPSWADLVPEITVQNLERPLFAVLKMPFANQVDPQSKLPVSLYANAMGTFERLDRLYNDFNWETDSGRRKQIFDITAVQNSGQIKQTDLAHYKTTDQYLVLDMGNEAKPYDDYTPDMRVEEYQNALNLQVRLLESQIGVSTGTFDFDIKSGVSRTMTATEVLADENDTYNTVKAIQENGLKQGLIDLVYIYDTYATLYKLAPAGSVNPGVEFGDSIFEDTGTEFLRRKAIVDAGGAPLWWLDGWYLGIDEEEAKKLVQAANEERQAQYSTNTIFGAAPVAPGEDGV